MNLRQPQRKAVIASSDWKNELRRATATATAVMRPAETLATAGAVAAAAIPAPAVRFRRNRNDLNSVSERPVWQFGCRVTYPHWLDRRQPDVGIGGRCPISKHVIDLLASGPGRHARGPQSSDRRVV